MFGSPLLFWLRLEIVFRNLMGGVARAGKLLLTLDVPFILFKLFILLLPHVIHALVEVLRL